MLKWPLRCLAVFILCLVWPLSPTTADEILNGAGATFPKPFYDKVIEEYQNLSPTRVDYQGVGSGTGIDMLLNRRVDFGASDIFLFDDDLERIGTAVVHIPTCVGAVAIIYHLPPNTELKLDAALLANVLMGEITQWADRRIRAVHDIPLPKMDITVVHRSDSSGTTFLLTDYLSKTNGQWAKTIGRGKKVDWPAGIGVAGNAGVAEMVLKIPGSVGYVSLNYAERRGLAAAAMKNRSGHYVKPTQESVSMAAQVPIPEDCRLLITDTPAANGYPISAFTYLLVYQEQAYDNRTRRKAEALVDFLTWILDDGQAYTKPLHYAPLPPAALNQARKAVRSIFYDGGH